jgi:hypothetical protein
LARARHFAARGLQLGHQRVVAVAQPGVVLQLLGDVTHDAEDLGRAVDRQPVGADQALARLAVGPGQAQRRGDQHAIAVQRGHQVFQYLGVHVPRLVGQGMAHEARWRNAQQAQQRVVGVAHDAAVAVDDQHRRGVEREGARQHRLGAGQGGLGLAPRLAFAGHPLPAPPDPCAQQGQRHGRRHADADRPVALPAQPLLQLLAFGSIVVAAQPAQSQGLQAAVAFQRLQRRLQPPGQVVASRRHGKGIGLQREAQGAGQHVGQRRLGQGPVAVGPGQERCVGLAGLHGPQRLCRAVDDHEGRRQRCQPRLQRVVHRRARQHGHALAGQRGDDLRVGLALAVVDRKRRRGVAVHELGPGPALCGVHHRDQVQPACPESRFGLRPGPQGDLELDPHQLGQLTQQLDLEPGRLALCVQRLEGREVGGTAVADDVGGTGDADGGRTGHGCRDGTKAEAGAANEGRAAEGPGPFCVWRVMRDRRGADDGSRGSGAPLLWRIRICGSARRAGPARPAANGPIGPCLDGPIGRCPRRRRFLQCSASPDVPEIDR